LKALQGKRKKGIEKWAHFLPDWGKRKERGKKGDLGSRRRLRSLEGEKEGRTPGGPGREPGREKVKKSIGGEGGGRERKKKNGFRRHHPWSRHCGGGKREKRGKSPLALTLTAKRERRSYHPGGFKKRKGRNESTASLLFVVRQGEEREKGRPTPCLRFTGKGGTVLIETIVGGKGKKQGAFLRSTPGKKRKEKRDGKASTSDSFLF